MYDTSKLKGRIIEKFDKQNAFAKAVGSSSSFVSQYLNGRKDLTQPVIDKWAEVLDIPADEIHTYFFKKKVHETELEERGCV
jgi:transcriptional regulator with XRE-family HTH domain